MRLLAGAIKTLPLPILRPLLKKAVVGGRGDKMPSFYIDMQAGRKQSEVTYLNGAVARFGEQVGLDAPVNRFLRIRSAAWLRGKSSGNGIRRSQGVFLEDLNR